MQNEVLETIYKWQLGSFLSPWLRESVGGSDWVKTFSYRSKMRQISRGIFEFVILFYYYYIKDQLKIEI